MRSLTTALEVLGGCSIVAGIALIYPPAGLIVAGALAIVFSWRIARS